LRRINGNRPLPRPGLAVRRRHFPVLLLAAVLPPGVAHAHAILLESQPESGGSVPAGRVVLHLRYNSRIDRARSRLTLIGPDHAQTVVPIAAETAPDMLSGQAMLSPGHYVLRWQVLAIDGHITRGDLPFSVSGD
jgi:methionine-rich copper-binding protein CopC